MSRRTLEVRALSHRYGREPTFEDVGLSVEAGRVTAVLGPSGCGKTTLLRCIAGFETPTSGSIRLGERALVEDGVTRVPVEARRIGLVFQDYALFPHLSVVENVAFGMTGPDRHERARDWLARMGLDGLEARSPHALSGGQQQRVALARALATDPDLLLLDEPFANVDASRRARLVVRMKERLGERGVATLLVTHDRVEALGLADRVCVMVDGGEGTGGRIVQDDAPEVVYRRPVDPRVAELTGEAVWIDAEADGGTARSSLGAWPLAEAREGAVRCLVRPESLRFVPSSSGLARVTAREYLGRCWRISLVTPAGRLAVETDEPVEPGATGALESRGPLWALPREADRVGGGDA